MKHGLAIIAMCKTVLERWEPGGVRQAQVRKAGRLVYLEEVTFKRPEWKNWTT